MNNDIRRKYLPEFVYGAIDGSVTTFAVVAGSLGASLSTSIILILGCANLIGDGFSMAASNYLSTKSQNELSSQQRKRPIKTALATFFSFIGIGLIPLFSYIAAFFFPSISMHATTISFILTACAFLFIGAVKGLVVKKHPIAAALETLLIGALAALLAFIVGAFIKSLIGLN